MHIYVTYIYIYIFTIHFNANGDKLHWRGGKSNLHKVNVLYAKIHINMQITALLGGKYIYTHPQLHIQPIYINMYKYMCVCVSKQMRVR